MTLPRRQAAALGLTAIVVFALAGRDVARAEGIAISFTGSVDAAVAPGEVVGFVPQFNWNNADGANGTTANVVGPSPGTIVNSDGNPTGVTIAWSSESESFSTPAAPLGVGDRGMFQGVLRATPTTAGTIGMDVVIELSNINSVISRYDVYLYLADAAGPNHYRVFYATFGGFDSVEGIGSPPGPDAFNDQTQPGDDTVVLLGEDLTFDVLTFQLSSIGGLTENPVGIAGIQLVVPEPGSLVLLFVATCGFCVWCRRVVR
jgi:hypothetical protein